MKHITKEDLYIMAISHYGDKQQKVVAMEEMAELIQAISKDIRDEANNDNLAEEIADVEIMLEQLQIMYNNRYEVITKKQKKLKRLYERIMNETHNK